jgi:hypothetical protein
MEKGRVANFHGQASDAYAHVWMVQGSLFSWITLIHGKLHDFYMCIIIMCNIELINKLCLYYIHSKEIRCFVITSNNAPVVK